MSTIVATAVSPAGWLRSREFDAWFIYGVAALALASGALALAIPALFVPIVLLDLWLLGYHHVVATYTRLCFDRRSFSENQLLLVWVPLGVVLGVVALFVAFGVWALASIYLYWQWFHYTRQSWGIANAYRRKAGDLAIQSPRLDQAAMYLVPLWGILHRSHQAPATFLGLELRVIPIPALVVDIAGVAALVALLLWAAPRLVAWRNGRLPVAHTAYVASHLLIFYFGYVAIEQINPGWLVLNVWHNAQYVLFVWLFNSNRFKNGIDPQARFLSTISQPKNAWKYFASCLGISTLIYGAIKLVVPLGMLMIVYQVINFHHYIVDALIWKLRRKKLQETLEISQSA
ncbi:MAG: hypothetical protein ACREH6_11585 [Geminicoccaceae bacterium]